MTTQFLKDNRLFIIAATAWQDSLLQSYRTFHVAVQGFLVASGATVLAVQLTGAVQGPGPRQVANLVFNCFFTLILALLAQLQQKTSVELRRIVNARAADVDYWHEQLLVLEAAVDSPNRLLTAFKMHQQARRAEVEYLVERNTTARLSRASARQLIEKGNWHTRKVFDVNLFSRLQYIWHAILGISVGITGWFLFLTQS